MEVVTQLVDKKSLVIFSKSSCCLSHSIKQLISRYANATVFELDEIPNGKEIEKCLLRLGNTRSVPAIFIGQKYVGGYKEILSLHVRGELVPILNEISISSNARKNDQSSASTTACQEKSGLPGNPDPDAEVIDTTDSDEEVIDTTDPDPDAEVIDEEVYVCPEPSCVHHEASQAFGDFAGIKKHFYSKHGMSGITTDSSTSHQQLPQSLPLEREQPDNHHHHQKLGHGQRSNKKTVRSRPRPTLLELYFRSLRGQSPLQYTRDIAYEDMYSCLNSLKILQNSANVSQECLDCLVYCSLFPKDYEIDRDTLIQLWMAEDLIKEEPMEDIAASYLRALCKHGQYISLLREDCGTGKIWYKVKRFEISEQVLEISKIIPVKAISVDSTSVLSATETENCHVTLQRLLPTDLQALGRFSKISTLLLLRNHKANVASIPYDFFMSLQHLRALDLSRTKVSELPSSIGNARSLRYLDLSETLIKRLPETAEFLLNLQTLKLQNCPRLVALPKATRKLICLRHLDIGTIPHMHSMPAGIGALTSLRTLTEFIAGREQGCRIRELKNMNEIAGKFCLSKLENVTSLDDAKEANLSCKQRIKNLELRWTDDEHQESIGVNHEVIRYLQPHTNLQDLRIICYGGSRFPSWISHPSFVKLTKITLFKCPSCQILPSLGQLPSLESLSLIELAGIRIIDFHFRIDKLIAAADDNDQFVAFPALHKLEIKSMLNLEKWSDIEKVDFPCLRIFSIKNCPKLADLCELTNIKALEYLEINQCTMLPSLPEEKLPASLKTLMIEGCPPFSLSRSVDKNSDWIEQQHSPSLSIYQRNENWKEMNSMAGSSVVTHDPPQ